MPVPLIYSPAKLPMGGDPRLEKTLVLNGPFISSPSASRPAAASVAGCGTWPFVINSHFCRRVALEPVTKNNDKTKGLPFCAQIRFSFLAEKRQDFYVFGDGRFQLNIRAVILSASLKSSSLI